MRSWVSAMVGTAVGDRGGGVLVGVAVAGGVRVGDGEGVKVGVLEGEAVEADVAEGWVSLLWSEGAAAGTVARGVQVGSGVGLGVSGVAVEVGGS